MGHTLPRILCIEDDDDTRFALGDALADEGFDVRSAPDGHRAIDAFLTGGADLVLVDLGLPDMDGVAVCRALKTLAADSYLPVICLTGNSDTRTKVRVLEAGADEFCVKPCSCEELAARIRSLLRIRDRELHLQTESGRFRRLALVDPLTELGNRRAFEVDLEREWARTARNGSSLALLMVDIDRFKDVNDRHGHAAGDLVLKAVAASIADAVRVADQAYRYGGEEFTVLLPDASRDGAILAGERVRRTVAGTKVAGIAVTVSVGIACAPDPALPARGELIEAADRALYEAKASGRDRVVARGPHVAL